MSSTTGANLLHAAECWLERIGANPAAVVVVFFDDPAALGVWSPPQAHVGRLIPDEAAVEVLEAAAAWLDAAVAAMPAQSWRATTSAMLGGARLQALVTPSMQGASLRVVHGGTAIPIIDMLFPAQLH